MTPDFIQLAKNHKRRIVLPESEDNRILEAAVHCDKQKIAEIILLGNTDSIHQQLFALGLEQGNVQIINPDESRNLDDYAETLSKLRAKHDLSKVQALTLSKQTLNYANLMVHAGDADGCVAGVNTPTGDVIRAALQLIGTKTPETRLSSFFIMLCKTIPSPVLFADCAINIAPDAMQLADIAYQTSQNAKFLLGLDPKVALLSFSTSGSAKHENVDKIQEATILLHKNYPELNVIGDVQFDAALSGRILHKKWSGTTFKAPANVFIFPSLEAGNIGYKIAEHIGGATAIGPILQGLAKPINDLSRGASIESIISTIAVTALQG